MSCLLIMTAVYCLFGIQNRDRTSIILYLTMSGVCSFCYFMQLFTGDAWIKAASVIAMIIQMHGFVTFSSLYHKFNGYDPVTSDFY